MRDTSETEVFFVLNQRWTLLVLRALSDGPIRFNELSKSAGLNPNTLRERLRDLERIGVVERNVVSSLPPRVEYRLTSNGADLSKMFRHFNMWLSKYAAIYELNKNSYAADAARPSNAAGH